MKIKLLTICLLSFTLTPQVFANDNINNEIIVLLQGIYGNIENVEYQIKPTSKNNFYHVIIDHGTHQRNYIYDVKNKIFENVGDGGLKIKNGAIYRYWAKSYFPEWVTFLIFSFHIN